MRKYFSTDTQNSPGVNIDYPLAAGALGLTPLRSQKFSFVYNKLPDQSTRIGTAVSLQVGTTTSDNTPVTFTANGLPSGLSISSSGLISGTAVGNPRIYSTSIIMTLLNGVQETMEFQWESYLVYPVLQQIPNQSDVTNIAISGLQIEAAHDQTLTYTTQNLPAGLSVNSGSGLITGTPTTAAVYNPVWVRVSDGIAAAQTSFSWEIVSSVAEPDIVFVVAGEHIMGGYSTNTGNTWIVTTPFSLDSEQRAFNYLSRTITYSPDHNACFALEFQYIDTYLPCTYRLNVAANSTATEQWQPLATTIDNIYASLALGMIYGNGKFAALLDDGNYVLSTPGTSANSSPTSWTYKDFEAGHSNTSWMTTPPDGYPYSPGPNWCYSTNYMGRLAGTYGNGIYLTAQFATFYDNSNTSSVIRTTVHKSTDLENWEVVKTFEVSESSQITLTSIEYANGVYLLTAYNNADSKARIYRSVDATSWNMVFNNTIIDGEFLADFSQLKYDSAANKWYALNDGRSYISIDDGQTWNQDLSFNVWGNNPEDTAETRGSYAVHANNMVTGYNGVVYLSNNSGNTWSNVGYLYENNEYGILGDFEIIYAGI